MASHRKHSICAPAKSGRSMCLEDSSSPMHGNKPALHHKSPPATTDSRDCDRKDGRNWNRRDSGHRTICSNYRRNFDRRCDCRGKNNCNLSRWSFSNISDSKNESNFVRDWAQNVFKLDPSAKSNLGSDSRRHTWTTRMGRALKGVRNRCLQFTKWLSKLCTLSANGKKGTAAERRNVSSEFHAPQNSGQAALETVLFLAMILGVTGTFISKYSRITKSWNVETKRSWFQK